MSPFALFIFIAVTGLLVQLAVSMAGNGKKSFTIRVAAFMMVSAPLVILIMKDENRLIMTDQGRLVYVAWMMVAGSLILHTTTLKKPCLDLISPLLAAVALLVSVFLTEPSSPEHYLVYERPDVNLFFYLRNSAAGLIALAISCFMMTLFPKNTAESEAAHLFHGRNFTLLGAGFYMAGEVAGSWWAFEGWGDPWRWSRGFLLAGAMFLLAMLPLHLPPPYRKHPKITALLASLPLSAFILLHLT
jgi:hypothetical protein